MKSHANDSHDYENLYLSSKSRHLPTMQVISKHGFQVIVIMLDS